MHRNRGIATAILMFAAFMDLLDVTIVNVALPAIRTDLDASGEAYMLEFTVDFAAARIPGVPTPPTTELLRGFRRAGAMYGLEAVFPPGSGPERLRQIHLSHVDAEENLVAPVALTKWDTSHVLVEQPAAGLHGLRWDWPGGSTAE